jgi:uncharacterized membrane protein
VGAGLLALLGREDGRRRLRAAGERLGAGWTPAARLLAGAAGGGLALYGVKRRDGVGAALGSVGLGLIARGLTERPLRELAALRRRAPVTEIQRAIHVAAPPAQAFALWLDADRLPEFLSRVHAVRDAGDGRTRWQVEGPSGVPVEWDVVVTAYETEREIAWRTVGDPDHVQELRVRVAPDAEGGTRVEAKLSCTPPETLAGRDLVTLFGPDPRRQLETDLARMKALAESVPARGETAEIS